MNRNNNDADCGAPLSDGELATDRVRQALTDLVALKNLKDAFEAEIAHAAQMGCVPSVKCVRAKRIYEREQPLAWARARAALAGGELSIDPITPGFNPG